MTLNEYQEKAMSTCMDSCNNFSYMMLNLVGEVGELSSKVAKMIRKGKFEIGGESNLRVDIKAMNGDDIETIDKELKLEAGDIAWQLAGLCKVFGWSLEDVCQANLDKLASRKARGVIDGNGDER
nr:MAG TPA: NTP-PPase-like protein [Caudoviricetes sp.]